MTPHGVARDGAEIVRLEGTLRRVRFPGREAALPGETAGSFVLASQEGGDLRASPGTVALETPRGRLAGVAAPPAPATMCRTAAAYAGLSPHLCGPAAPSSGLDLLHDDAAALVQSFTHFDGGPPLASDPRPQPGTIGFAEGPACARIADGIVVRLPGCPTPGDPDYDPTVDGPDPTGVSLGYPTGVGTLPSVLNPDLSGLVVLGPLGGHPFTGQPWVSDAAAFSWNLAMLLVAGTPGPGTASVDPTELFDPASPYRTDGCSYLASQHCLGVQGFRQLVIDALPDDPAGGPSRRWLWELGASYRITEATGDFASLLGGHLHAVGPFLSEAPGVAAQLAFFATAPPMADADEDGIDDARDRCPGRADAFQEDQDGDGAGDACDVCTQEVDPLQLDADADGFGNRCDADFDGDGQVSFRDLAFLRSRLYQRDARADLDGDGFVTLRDVLVLRQRFLRPPGPSALRP